MRNTAQQFAVDILAPLLSQEPPIGAVMATRILSTDPRSDELWAAIQGAPGAPKADALDLSIPLVNASWRQVLPQLQRAFKEKRGIYADDARGDVDSGQRDERERPAGDGLRVP